MDVKVGNPTQTLYKTSTSRAKSSNKPSISVGDDPTSILSQPASTSSYDVSLSTKAQEMRASYEKALQLAMATPDVREDKVAAWKERLKNGDYKVSSENIADGLMKEAMRDHLAQMG